MDLLENLGDRDKMDLRFERTDLSYSTLSLVQFL